jgi:catechol 2,3-dioxygenase-like lactoylglutathione lyase family enzyme
MPEYVSAYTSFAVPDIDAARHFYRDVLGLAVTDGVMGQLAIHLPGGGWVMVYPKPDHVPATYTMFNLAVSDIDAAVDDLASRGVEFARYDGLGQDERGIARSFADDRGPDIAWFSDPAGNIIAVLHTVD